MKQTNYTSKMDPLISTYLRKVLIIPSHKFPYPMLNLFYRYTCQATIQHQRLLFSTLWGVPLFKLGFDPTYYLLKIHHCHGFLGGRIFLTMLLYCYRSLTIFGLRNASEYKFSCLTDIVFIISTLYIMYSFYNNLV